MDNGGGENGHPRAGDLDTADETVGHSRINL